MRRSMAEFLDPKPVIIPCNIEIAHHQLRDLLQPAGEKGKVLFVNRLKIDCADFTTKKVRPPHFTGAEMENDFSLLMSLSFPMITDVLSSQPPSSEWFPYAPTSLRKQPELTGFPADIISSPTAFCTLNFTAVCLTTGSGLIATGGQQSELDIRPLFPLPTNSDISSSRQQGGAGQNSAASGSSSSNGSSNTSSNLNEASTLVYHPASFARNVPPRWHLSTPTGGSINNSICIQPDIIQTASTSSLFQGSGSPADDGDMDSSSGVGAEKDACRHREKRRKEITDSGVEAGYESSSSSSAWRRDDPSGRLDTTAAPPDASSSSPANHPSMPGLDGGFHLDRNRLGAEASEKEKLRRREEKRRAKESEVFRHGFGSATNRNQQISQPCTGSVRVLVSNNDQSVKEFRLRPPNRRAGTGSVSNSRGETIESDLPGLTRIQVVEFPTCINHSSFSPDGRHLVSVGDTPEVFIYSVDPVAEELTKIATYTASSDASFSTSWSPDGLQFAVASQDGLVCVWDVRSASKVASLRTSQAADIPGNGAARVVKWSPRGDLLAFSEHTNYFHIVETNTFTTVQRIKVPSLSSSSTDGAGGEAAPCTSEITIGSTAGNGNGGSGGGVDPRRLPPSLPPGDAVRDLLSAAENAELDTVVEARLERHWPSARRYREMVTSGTLRSPLDRALLGEWSGNRRRGTRVGVAGGGSSNSMAEVYIDNRPPPSRDSTSQTVLPSLTASSAVGSARSGGGNGREEDAGTAGSTVSGTTADPSSSSSTTSSNPSTTLTTPSAVPASGDPSASMLFRTVDSIMTTFENEVGVHRNANSWSLGALHRRIHRNEEGIDISGLTWDPDGEYLYVSTLELVAQYSLLDLRQSFGQAAMR